MTIKYKTYLVILVSTLALSSCDFTERGCIYYGWLVSQSHWDHLTKDQLVPDYSEMNIVYYPLTGEATKTDIGRSERFDEEILRRKLHIGKYDLLVFNKANNPVRRLEDRAEDAEIYSVLVEDRGKQYITTDQEFVYSAFSSEEEISCDDTTYCHFNPKILVQKIIFNVTVKGMSDKFPVKVMDATLDGVTTSRWIYTGRKGLEYASRRFTIDNIKDNKYRKELLVFGINNTPQNTMTIIGDFGNNVTDSVDLDLSKVLKNFNADQIEINIEIEVSPNFKLSASISDWKNHDWGTIIIY